MAPRRPAGKNLSSRILATIKRDQTDVASRVIWAHEYPLLEAIHGEGNVVIVDATKLDEGFNPKASPELLPYNKRQDKILPPSETHGIGFVFTGDARSEYDRLSMVYGRMKEVNIAVVEHVYGRFQDGKFERMLGLADFEDMPAAQLRELIIAHGYLPLTDKDSSPEQRAEAERMRTELMGMEVELLCKLADEITGAHA